MSGLEAAVALTAALAWPGLMAGLALGFRAEWRALLRALAALVERTRQIEVGRIRALTDRPPRRPRA
jgi:hypothetical protein